MAVRLYLVRHGETGSNRLGLALGQADVPLNERGRRQAGRLADALAAVPLAAVYSSSLSRALDTARTIAGRHGLDVIVEPGLIEMNIGELEGLAFPELRERFPGLLDSWMSDEGPYYCLPGGERLVDVQARALKTLRELAERHREDEAVCAVTHNFLILSMLTSILGINLSNFRRVRQAVAGVSVIEIKPGGMRLASLNDTCHLRGLG